MSDRDKFVRQICEQPADDTHRLVYADWLDEHGEPERAEFIRVQVGIARLVASGYPCFHDLTRPDHCDRCRLDKRERDIWEGRGHKNASKWANVIRHRWGLGGAFRHRLANRPNMAATDAHAIFRRGFVESVTLPLAAFTESAARALFAAHPVTTVTLTDKQTALPDYWHADECYEPPDDENLPDHLFELMWEMYPQFRESEYRPRFLEFPSNRDAHAALSAVCVAWGRSLAGLDPLPR